MKSTEQLFNRVTELKEYILLMEEKHRQEMTKPFFRRDYQLLSFFKREQKKFEYALQQLQWLIDD